MIKKIRLQIHNHFVSVLWIFTLLILMFNEHIYIQIFQCLVLILLCISEFKYDDKYNNITNIKNQELNIIKNWNYEREFGLNELYVKRENAFKEFLQYMHFHDCFAYEYKCNSKTFIIYTNHSGIWIGYQGTGRKYLEELLSRIEGYDIHVEFKELNGKFLNL